MTSLNRHRKLVSAILRKRKRLFGANHEHHLTLSNIDHLISFPKHSIRSTEKSVREQIPDEIFLCDFSIACLAMIFACINEEKRKDYPLPSNWISRSGRPNPNFVIRSLVGQVTDHSLSTLNLIRQGMDNSARALLRVTDELIWQSLVIISYQDDMKEYVKAETPGEANKTWQRLFGRGRLIRKIESLERDFGFDEEYLGSMTKWRREAMAFYSQGVHHSYVATAVGLYSLDLDEKTTGHGIFGAPKVGLRGTINHLNFQLFYFIHSFYNILEKKHSVNTEEGDLFCYFAQTLRWCHYALCVDILAKEFKFSDPST